MRACLFVCLASAWIAGTARAVTLAPGDILAANGASVIKVDPTTGDQVVVTTGDHLSRALGIAYDATRGILYVADTNSDGIYRVDPSDGTQTPVASGLGIPRAILVDADGTLLVTEGGTLYRVDPSDGSKTPIGNQSGGVSELVMKPDGDVLVASAGSFGPDYGNDGAIVTFDLPGGASSTLVGGAPFVDPQGLALWSNYIVVADAQAGSLYTLDPNAMMPTPNPLLASDAVSLAVGPDDCLYWLSQSIGTISRLCPNVPSPSIVASDDLLPNAERIAIVPEPGALADDLVLLAPLAIGARRRARARRSSFAPRFL